MTGQGRTVTLKRIVAVAGEEGSPASYVIVEVAEPFSFLAVAASAQPDQGKTRTLIGGEFLDEFFSGGPAWHETSDRDVWLAGREFAAECGGERAELLPFGRGEEWHRPQFSGLLYGLNALLNLALIHRMGNVSVRLQDVSGVQ